ncbi:hypothetical protein ACLVWQ_10055 (plasmid) [Streptomyces sp. CWNU-52B]|uniref:hypothetical protein n=1 Tax=unclassified Streptomyces TaxID=2593676 RepID=UPI0039C19F6F
MTPEERREILGDEVIEQIRQRVALAPDPSPELVEKLRRIFARPGGPIPAPAESEPEHLTAVPA